MVQKTTLAVSALLLTICSVSFGSVTFYTPPAGDAQYAWNSKYGPYGYTTGATTMGVYLYFGAPYGNDYTVSIFEVPVSALAGQTLTSAILEVDIASEFGTNYYYGSAQIGWLDTGTKILTGDVVADGLGSTSTPGGPEIYDTYTMPGTPGTRTFDFLSSVQADIDAGRSYSSFVMHGSRETYGSIYTAESGFGPRLIVTTAGASMPVPGSLGLVFVGGLLVRKLRRQ